MTRVAGAEGENDSSRVGQKWTARPYNAVRGLNLYFYFRTMYSCVFFSLNRCNSGWIFKRLDFVFVFLLWINCHNVWFTEYFEETPKMK